jgi:hypothetical protein
VRELVEDRQGLLPGLRCGCVVAGVLVDVAEPPEGDGFQVVVAEFAS